MDEWQLAARHMFESSLDFHIVRTNASYGMNGGGIRFSSFGNQFCKVKQRSESRKLSYGEGILAYTAHIEGGRKLIGDIICEGDSGASIVGTCFAQRSGILGQICIREIGGRREFRAGTELCTR